ncbi:MAG: hypothetical protein CVU55_02645 [Deltaproteobacteria bacterium HGW-Deltaproteobacteria-13]|jgi:hypothetical protein|nr:MAG: hypothetical protein CVU55_02645 [Deltaproteobacteria bacterium HGW-Deltaproteobacteria-13]
MKKINFNINKKSILYLGVYLGIIFVVILVGILPLSWSISKNIKQNEELSYKIKEQKELGPVYASLLNAMKNKNLLTLPHPEKTSLARSEAGKFQDDFQVIVKKTGLKILSFTPDLNTSAASSTSFLHQIVLRGEFSDFRKMLIGLGAVPYLDKIEEINIQQGTDSMEFRMKVWIALK